MTDDDMLVPVPMQASTSIAEWADLCDRVAYAMENPQIKLEWNGPPPDAETMARMQEAMASINRRLAAERAESAKALRRLADDFAEGVRTMEEGNGA